MRSKPSIRRRHKSRKTRPNGVTWDRLGLRFRPLRVESLEARRLLTAFSEFGNDLATQVGAIQTFADNALQGATDPLKGLPFIGSQLVDSAAQNFQSGVLDQAQSAIANAVQQIQTDLGNFTQTSVSQAQFTNELYKVLGSPTYTQNGQQLAPNGLNILGAQNYAAGNGASTPNDIHVTNWATNGASFDVEMRLHENVVAGNGSNLTFNLGLPSLPFAITSTGGVTVSVGFDYELAADFNSSPNSLSLDWTKKITDNNTQNLPAGLSAHTLVFSVQAGLTPGASLSANVGFLQGSLTANGTNSLNAQINVDSLQASAVTLTGGANVNLTGTLGLCLGQTGAFPSIGANITMNWQNLADPTTLTFQFGNVQLYLGTFLQNFVSPILGYVNQYAAPLEAVTNFLTEPIPGISSLPGCKNVNLMSIIDAIAKFHGDDTSDFGSLVDTLNDITSLIQDVGGVLNSIGSNATINFGSFNLDPSKIAANGANYAGDAPQLSNVDLLGGQVLSSLTPADLGDGGASLQDFNPGNNISGADQNTATVVKDLTSNASISFPLLDNPASAFGLFVGQDVPLVTINAHLNIPVVSVDVPLIVVPVFGPISVWVNFTSSVGLDASLAAGYDTYGLRMALNDLRSGQDGSALNDILDGFYIQGPNGGDPDTYTQVSATGHIGFDIEGGINLGFASAGLGFEAGIDASIGITLNTNGAAGGKIRLNQIEGESLGQIFAPTGGLSAGLTAILSFSVMGFNQKITLCHIVEVPIWEASCSVTPPAQPPQIFSMSTQQGPADSSNTITIYGSNLENATVNLTVPIFIGLVVGTGTITKDTPSCIVVDIPAEDQSQSALLALFGNTADVVVTTPGAGSSATTPADKYTYIQAPVVTSIDQHEGPACGGTLVTIHGSNLENATAVNFGSPTYGNTLADIVSDSADGSEITCYSPGDYNIKNMTGVEAVQVSVTTAGGTSVPYDSLSSTPLSPAPEDFFYIPPPVITGISPSWGLVKQAQSITIKGQYFGNDNDGNYVGTVTGVQFDNQSVSFQQATYVPAYTYDRTYYPAHWEVTVNAPVESTSCWDYVNVTTAVGGTSDVNGLDDGPANTFTYAAPPSITSISPMAGPVTPLFGVAIYGTNFAGVTVVSFGQTNVFKFTVKNGFNGWEIDLTPPAASGPGEVDVSVYSLYGWSNSVQYDYTSLPVVDALSKAAGPLGGGTTVTIFGANLENATYVSFGPFPTQGSVISTMVPSHEFAYDSSTEIKLNSPMSFNAGTVDVQVLTSPGCYSATSAADQFTYTAAPIVSKVSPNFGPYEGGIPVTISGQNLANAWAVHFGSLAAASFSENPDGTITAVTPAFSLGSTWRVDVTVTTVGGTSAISSDDKFNNALVPAVVDGLTPASGPATGGTTVTITGQYFMGAVGVYFCTEDGSTPATSFTVDSSTTITAVSPAGVAGTVGVQVNTPYEWSIDMQGDQFTYLAVAGIGSVSPSSGPVAGGTTVTIAGEYLDGVKAVDFGTIPAASFTSNPDGTVTATSPASPGNATGPVDVTVETEYGWTTTTTEDQFSYYMPGPVLSSISPNSGSPLGQTPVIITGSNLSYVTTVDFGSNPGANLTYNADGTLKIYSPGGAQGSVVDVTLVNALGGTSPEVAADKFTYGLGPTISCLSFNAGPVSIPGVGLTIYGANLLATSGTTEVNFGSSPGEIVSNSGTQMYVIVPTEAAGTVNVTVTTINGTSPFVPADHYTFVAGPLVESLALTSNPNYFADGPQTGGTSVTISGYGLTGATAVKFGSTPAESFIVNGDTQIVAISPPEAPGSVAVTVTTPQGTSSTESSNPFTYAPVPIVFAVSPAFGSLRGGNTVLITGASFLTNGTAFDGRTEVDFGGVPGTILGYEGYDILAWVPPGSSYGTVNVTVVTAGGASATSSADQYTYLPPPAVTGLSRSSGAVEGGTPVVVTGTNLAGATEVDFGGDPATIVGETDGQIMVTSPSSPTDDLGMFDVTVTTAGGTSAISEPADQFTYTHAPFITEVTGAVTIDGDAAGLVTGGTTVSVVGNDLADVTAVNFGGTPAISFSYSASYRIITAVSPAATTPGSVDITLTNPSGTSDISPADEFLYVAAPAVSGVSPALGSGGTQVLVTGSGLANATEVDFGSSAGTIISDTDGGIVATSPQVYLPGAVDVTVVTPVGASCTSTADLFTYMPQPSVSSESTYSGTVGGGTAVTLSGTGLANATVDFGANPGTVTSNTDGQIVVFSPEATNDSPGPVSLTVTTAFGAWTGQFTYALPPDVTAISRSSGPVAGGTQVTISGDNLLGAKEVEFGGVPAASLTDNGDGTLSAVSPPGILATVDVTVIAPGGATLPTPADQFTYVAVPSVACISPAAGSLAGGDQVTIIGTGLANATEVYFSVWPYGSVGTIVPGSNTDSQIVVISPPPSVYWDYAGATADVTVITSGGTSAATPADQFTYVAAPTVTGISLTSGFRSGGDLVTITGTNLDGATAVDFGQNAATIQDESATQIDVYSPGGTVGTVDVKAVTPGGTSPTSAADQFTYVQPAPAVSGVSPSAGTLAGGTAVTITGTDLDGATEVDFGGVAGTIVPGSDTATQIVVTDPAGSVGTVDVTVTTPGGISAISPADEFTYVAAPTVSAVVTSATVSGGTSASIAAGPATGGSNVVIYGTDLDGATAVKFGETSTTILVDADTYIVATSPAGTAGTIDVTVTTPYGASPTSSADHFTYVVAPSTAADSYTATAGSTLTVASPGVLANDTGMNLAAFPLSAALMTGPAHGTLSLSSDGSFRYTPNSGYLGPDSFTYQATNSYANSVTTTVSLAVVPAKLTWNGGPTGNWTDHQWSGASSISPYPTGTANAVIGVGSIIQVSSDETANALAIQSGGQVAIGPGTSLMVTTNTSVTGGSTLNVDPNGLFSTGGTFTLDTGGSIAGGPILAGQYDLNSGTASANLGGLGGVTKDTSGTVTLSGTNTYAGPTVVKAGTLIVTSSSALPGGTSLTVGAGGVFIFDPSQAVGGPVAAAAASALSPAVASTSAVLASIPTRSASEDNSTAAPALPVSASVVATAPAATMPASVSAAASDAVFAAHRSVFDGAVSTAKAAESARPWAWLAAVENWWNSADRNKTTDSAIAALDQVLARYGV